MPNQVEKIVEGVEAGARSMFQRAKPRRPSGLPDPVKMHPRICGSCDELVIMLDAHPSKPKRKSKGKGKGKGKAEPVEVELKIARVRFWLWSEYSGKWLPEREVKVSAGMTAPCRVNVVGLEAFAVEHLEGPKVSGWARRVINF